MFVHKSPPFLLLSWLVALAHVVCVSNPAPSQPAAGPAKPPTQSSSGFASGVKTPAPAATPAPTTKPAAPPVAGSSSLTLTDKDLEEEKPIGPEASPVPPVQGDLRVLVGGRLIPSATHCVIVDPAEEVTIEVEPFASDDSMKLPAAAAAETGRARTFEVMESTRTAWSLAGGVILRREGGAIVWRAPAAAGACKLAVSVQRQTRFEELSQASAVEAPVEKQGFAGAWETTFIVRRPFDAAGDGILDGSTIGIYPAATGDAVPAPVKQHPDAYTPPKYLVPVTPETARLYVTRHLRLGDYSPAAERARPHYIALQTRLVDFLDAAGDRLAEAGQRPDSLKILRGFVSPYAREALARGGVNLVRYTRHQYGDGAVVIVDANGDGKMDDLNADGATTVADADALAAWLDALQKARGTWGAIIVQDKFQDGAGGPDTPCVHVDLRGWSVRERQGGGE